MPSLIQRFRSGWNAFMNRDPTKEIRQLMSVGSYGYGIRPDQYRTRVTSARSVIAKVYNRLALDVASVRFMHATVNDDGTFADEIKDGLDECLTLSANIDQTGMFFIKDLVSSMFDEGSIAAVPVDTTSDPTGNSESFDILSMRVGRITAWYPYAVRVECYNERTGKHEEVVLPKSSTAIIENPFYAMMNEPNSTLQRLLSTIRKLDAYNEKNAVGKLDLIIQLPYVIKSEQRRKEAEQRRKDLEEQLSGSALGIGYIDGTEKVVQLNKSLENDLWTQTKELQTQLYNELGLTETILDGTADEQTYMNYFNNTIAPICQAICDEMTRKFLSRNARSRGQAVVYFRDPFKVVPISKVADIGDKMKRNTIMTSNELRAKLGLRPSSDPSANQLVNPALYQNQNGQQPPTQGNPTQEDYQYEEDGGDINGA